MAISETVPAAEATPPAPRRPPWRAAVTALHVLLVRLRFVLVLLAVLLLVGYWHVLRNYWDRLTRPARGADTAVSSDTEYWCPMCPGVLSDWPNKCPVCNMALVRRKKGEAAPLPDGVVARMQLSPYRVQLAGVRTTSVAYLPLAREAVLVGFVEAPGEAADPGRAAVLAEVSEREVALVPPGQAVEATADAYPGRTFAGKVRPRPGQMSPQSRTLRVWLELDDAGQELRPGMFVTARAKVPAARAEWAGRAWADEWRTRTALDLAARSLVSPAGPGAEGGLEPLLRLAASRLLLERGLVPAVPEGAVIDTGAAKVVYVERMPGTFDGVEVALGPRCGGYYPVLRGVEAGDQVVTAGAFLLDAETRLNPSIAASYFGAGRRSSTAPAADVPQPTKDLTAEDKALAAKQKVCPVTGEPLDSMGGPVKVVVNGRTVFVCCEGCETPLRKNPAKYLANLP